MKGKDVLRKDKIATVIISALMLTGCNYEQEIEQFTHHLERIGNQHQDIQEQLSEYVLSQEKPESEAQVEQANYVLIDEREDVQNEQKEAYVTQKAVKYYAYETLNDEQKALYLQLYEAMSAMEREVMLLVTEPQVLKYVFQCVMNDHPELFYVGEWSYTTFSQLEEIRYMTFSVTYTMTLQEVQQQQKLIESYVNQAMQEAPNTVDEYEIAKYFYEYVIEHTEYDLTAEESQNICSVFINRKSVCQGYAKALQYLLQSCGIETYLITGMANQGLHAWNLVKVNGAYYYIDATWGDASYVLENGQAADASMVPTINYDYLLVTSADLMNTHQVDSQIQMPVCDAVTDNFYIREGLYLDCYDEQKLTQIFDSFCSQERKYLTIKCSDDVIYQEVCNKLIGENKVFFFLKNRTEGITYSENVMQRTLCFWI